MILDHFEKKKSIFAPNIHVLPKLRLPRGSCPYNSETLTIKSVNIVRRRSFCRRRGVTNINEVKQ